MRWIVAALFVTQILTLALLIALNRNRIADIQSLCAMTKASGCEAFRFAGEER